MFLPRSLVKNQYCGEPLWPRSSVHGLGPPSVSSHSSNHHQKVFLTQFSLYIHKGSLKPHLFHLHGCFFTELMTHKCDVNISASGTIHLTKMWHRKESHWNTQRLSVWFMPLFVWLPDFIVHGICTQTILYYWEIYVCIVLWRNLIFSTVRPALITHLFRLWLGAQEFQCCLYHHGTQQWWFVLFLFWSAAPSSLSHLNHVYCCVRTRSPPQMWK